MEFVQVEWVVKNKMWEEMLRELEARWESDRVRFEEFEEGLWGE